MAAQAGILFWRKNRIDFDNTNVVITITDAVATNTGGAFVDLMRNRSNTDGWRTTGSTDAANTQIDVDMVDEQDIDNILLVGMNLKAYTIQYWNGSTFTDFSTAISETTNTDTTKRHTFNQVTTSQVRIIITGTMTADDQKKISQLILTELFGQLAQEPSIGAPMHDENKKISRYVSGKNHIKRTVGAFEFTLTHKSQIVDADLDVYESLYSQAFGFIVSLSGFDTSQFRTVRKGYRLQDIYYMKMAGEYVVEHADGHFDHGINLKHKFVEVN